MESQLEAGLGEKALETLVGSVVSLAGQDSDAASLREKCGYIVIAVGRSQMAVFQMQQGHIQSSLGRVMFKAPLDDIQHASVKSAGLRLLLSLSFRNGNEVIFDVPRSQGSRLHHLVEVLDRPAC